MNKEQLDAIKERVKNSQTSNYLRSLVIEKDVPTLVAEVEKLNLEFLVEYTKYDRMLERLYAKSGENERLREENKRLREALKFYADGQKYTLAYDSNLVGTVEIFKDNGKKARQALGDGDE